MPIYKQSPQIGVTHFNLQTIYYCQFKENVFFLLLSMILHDNEIVLLIGILMESV